MKRVRAVRPAPQQPQPQVVVHGRVLTRDTEVSIRGERGRFRFKAAAQTAAGRITCTFIGGPAGHEQFRSFYPDRIRTVHRIARTRANASAA